jgi:hypothetical protein
MSKWICKWSIEEKEFDTASEVAQYIIDNLGEDIYDEMLDECYEEIEICGYSYTPSIALYRVDKIAYQCSMNDYYDSLSSDIEYELERMNDSDTEEFYGYTVEYFDEDEDEDEE